MGAAALVMAASAASCGKCGERNEEAKPKMKSMPFVKVFEEGASPLSTSLALRDGAQPIKLPPVARLSPSSLLRPPTTNAMTLEIQSG